MLLELRVKDFAIIDSIHISFGVGLNILSGETGAGKSVILKSLSLLMGMNQKNLSKIVKSTASRATVEGSFDLGARRDILQRLDEMGVDCPDEHLVVRRIISIQGKNRVYLNGHISPLAHLKDIVAPLIEVTGAPLIEMTGQHDSLHLQLRAYQLDTLDQYTGVWPLRCQVGENYLQIKRLNENLQSLREQALNHTQQLDFLTYQRDEIKAMNLQKGEEEELEISVRRMKNSSRFLEYFQDFQGVLYNNEGSVLSQLQSLLERGQQLQGQDPQCQDPQLVAQFKDLHQAKTLIEESVYEMRNYEKQWTLDPEALNEHEERLSRLRRLQKKYGKSVKEILQSLARIEGEISSIEDSDDKIDFLNQERDLLIQDTHKLCGELHQKRMSGALQLSAKVNKELLDLNMKGMTFDVKVEKLDKLQATGTTQIEFVIRSSQKDSWKPIAKIASGGELSRILLSFKRITSESQQYPRTYLFDEVDSGVSGLTAEKVGCKLKAMAQGQQVICVTHLAQVAAFADHHYVIEKRATPMGVHMTIHHLEVKDQVKEIARLISGEEITQTSLDHAKQLLRSQSVSSQPVPLEPASSQPVDI